MTTIIGAASNAFDEILKATPPALLAFLSNLPAVEGNFPDLMTFDINLNPAFFQ